jgi:GTP-binding protein EngB required for normal cell division
MDSQSKPDAGALNEFQERRLRVTCQYIDKLLGEVEGILNSAASGAAFPRYSGNFTPEQRRTMEDYVSRVRSQLVRVLDGQGILRENPSIPASRAIHVVLGAIDIAVEELRPQYMRGFGDLPEKAAAELNGIVGELRALVSRVDRYLVEGVGQDFKLRLERIEHKSNDLELLSRIEEIVARRGMVEFRPIIESILDRAEDHSFEIAVFGRVSSGKSSLLNAILETDVLPVGVTPITAVPTRIIYGEQPLLRVSFAQAPAKTMEVERLAEFATEQQNPGNAKRASRITVTLPARRLRDGVTFVDTPGLGSLATTGAAETLAYLPKCDLGVVLIDAGSTLSSEDLQTLVTLRQAAVSASVLLSKADLVNPQDREKLIEYARQHLAAECDVETQVVPVSVLPSHKDLLDRWFDERILPLYSRSQELRIVSLRRKIGALRESVISALEMQLERSTKLGDKEPGQVRATEARLRRATGLIEETRSAWETEIECMTQHLPEAFYEMSSRLIGVWSESQSGASSSDEIIKDSLLQFVQQRVEKLQHSLQTLAIQLRQDLGASAAELEISDAPGDYEFQSLVRGAPVFDLGSINASVSRPTLMLGKQLAEKRLARRLYRALGATANQSLDIYSGVLNEWVRFVTNEFARRFETYAERYRAHAERSLGGKELPADEISAIAENLRVLADPQTNDIVEMPSYTPKRNEPHTDSREIAGHVQKGEPR